MRIIIEDEEAVERVRRRGGDKSATEAVARLIREADAAPADPVVAYVKGAQTEDRGRAAEQRRRARKGAKS